MARQDLPSFLLFLCFVLQAGCQSDQSLSDDKTPGLPTVTVRGFLNFQTTVDGTVIVFTSSTSEGWQIETTEPGTKSDGIQTKDGVETHVDRPQKNGATVSQNTFVAVQTHAPDINILENKIKDQDLPHISDNAVLQSANELDRKAKSTQNPFPTGLVTVLGETVVAGSSTTVFETKVLGTYIDGKYAQILQSSFRTIDPQPVTAITSGSPLNLGVKNEHTDLKASEILSSEEKQTSSEALFTRSKEVSASTPTTEIADSSFDRIQPQEIPPSIKSEKGVLKTSEGTSTTSSLSSFGSVPKVIHDSFPTRGTTTIKNTKLITLRSSFSNPSMAIPDKNIRTQGTATLKTPELTSVSLTRAAATSEELLKSMSRKRFLQPQRPSQKVRLNRFKVKLTLRQNETLATFDDEIEELPSKEDAAVDIPMSVDPAQVVFRETTITSEVTLHVGRRKSIRTLTITTSIPLTVNPTDIQEILSAQSTAEPSEPSVLTRTYTTTENAMKTSIVPIFDGKSTMYHTVTESFFIMKIITAFRTLPSGDPSLFESFFDEPQPTVSLDAYAIEPSTQHLDTSNDPTEDTQETASFPLTIQTHKAMPLLPFGQALPNNPLAALYLGLQQLNAQITMYSTVTDLSTFVTTKTIYNTKTIRSYNGRSTRQRLKNEPISTTKVTLTKTITSVKPYINTHAVKQQQELQKLIAATQTPLNTITSTYATVTTATSLSTRIYTLIYNGFSTKYRTVTSTSLYPTTITLTTLLIKPTQINFPFAYPNTT